MRQTRLFQEALRKHNPYPMVQIHPDTAAAYGIKEGDWVKLETRFGSCRMMAQLEPNQDPNVVHDDHCYYYPERPEPEKLSADSPHETATYSCLPK